MVRTSLFFFIIFIMLVDYTGVCFLSPTCILTSSVDQRLSLWNVVGTATGTSTAIHVVVNKTRSQLHNIADPSSLLVHKIRSANHACCSSTDYCQFVL